MHYRHPELGDTARHSDLKDQIGRRSLQPVVGDALNVGEKVHLDLIAVDRRLDPGAFRRMIILSGDEDLTTDHIGELPSSR